MIVDGITSTYIYIYTPTLGWFHYVSLISSSPSHTEWDGWNANRFHQRKLTYLAIISLPSGKQVLTVGGFIPFLDHIYIYVCIYLFFT